jgi:hypothetical protein
MAKKTKSGGVANSTMSQGAIGAMCGLVALIIIIVIVLIILAFVPKKREIDVAAVKEKKECKDNSECYQKLCQGRLGCCAVCKDGKCHRGMLTQKGCVLDDESSEEKEKNPKANDKDMEQAFGMSKNYYDPAENRSCYQNSVASAPNTFNTMPCTSDEECYAKNCSGRNAYEGCGSVCESGMCWNGPVKAGSGVQTVIQQSEFPGWGSKFPSTWIISSSGPIYGATMGGCTVKPIGSALQNYTGFFQSCQPSGPTPSYMGYNERYNAYGPSFNTCG